MLKRWDHFKVLRDEGSWRKIKSVVSKIRYSVQNALKKGKKQEMGGGGGGGGGGQKAEIQHPK